MRIEPCFYGFLDSMLRHWLFMMMGGVDSGIVILAIGGLNQLVMFCMV